MALKTKTWTRSEVLACIEQGKQTITIFGRGEFHLFGWGFHGVMVKDIPGNILDFPLHMIEGIR